RVRNEGELGFDTRRRLSTRGNLRRVAMCERAISVEVRMTLRMMRALGRLAARTGAAGHASDEETRLREAKREQRNAREQRCSCKAAGVTDVRRAQLAQVLRDRASELGNPRRRAMRMLVDTLVGRCGRIAEVRGNIHDAHLAAALLTARQQPVDEPRGNSVGSRRKQRALPL